jgi:hypothetical protein
MISSQHIANDRAATLRRLKTEYLENDKKIAELQARNAKIRAHQSRLEGPIPKPDACPTCYYEHDIICALYPVPADKSDPTVDRYACENGHKF